MLGAARALPGSPGPELPPVLGQLSSVQPSATLAVTQHRRDLCPCPFPGTTAQGRCWVTLPLSPA